MLPTTGESRKVPNDEQNNGPGRQHNPQPADRVEPVTGAWLNPAVMDDVDVSPMFRLIGRLTAEHAGPGGCWPTRARVASQAGCSPRTVSRAWAALEAMGILHRRINAGAPGRGDLGGRRPNLITWAADVWEKGRQLLRDRRDRGTRRRLAAKAKAKADRRHPCQPTPDTGVNLKSQGRSQVQSESLVTVGDARKRDYDQLRDEIRRRKPPIL